MRVERGCITARLTSRPPAPAPAPLPRPPPAVHRSLWPGRGAGPGHTGGDAARGQLHRVWRARRAPDPSGQTASR